VFPLGTSRYALLRVMHSKKSVDSSCTESPLTTDDF